MNRSKYKFSGLLLVFNDSFKHIAREYRLLESRFHEMIRNSSHAAMRFLELKIKNADCSVHDQKHY